MKTFALLLSCFCALLVSCTRENIQPVLQTPAGTKTVSQPAGDCEALAAQQPMATIRGGSYVPLYGNDTMPVQVNDFLLDVYPVTNAQFLEFVRRNPQWRRSQVKKIFGDGNYLRSWKNDTTLGDGQSPRAPVTNVSWYAANAFCGCAGKRLATVAEWEYVAMADEVKPDARKDEAYTKYILEWYEKSNTFDDEVGSTYKNYWGVYDLQGLTWEWTADFNSVLMEDDSRKGTSGNNNLFCGDASIGASDLENYAAFMRYAFRASLKANYSVRNLGFRCAKDIP